MQGLKMCPRCNQSTAAMGSDHQSGREQGATWFLKDFKADQSKGHYRGSATAACLLIHSLQIQMLPLASHLPRSCTTCSCLGVADFCTTVAWDRA